jgi:hypothetical protein
MRDSTLFEMVEVRLLLTANKQNGAYEKYMVPDMIDEIHYPTYYQVRRTVTDNHV